MVASSLFNSSKSVNAVPSLESLGRDTAEVTPTGRTDVMDKGAA